MADQPTPPPNPPADRFDRNDALFYAGLLLMGAGLAFAFSWPAALIVVGAVLAMVALANSYVRIWMSRR
jgi:uncharacterized membrane protein